MSHQRLVYMALFSEQLHIRPWEMDLLTEKQFAQLVKYLDATNKE